MLTRLEDIIDRQRLVPAGPEGLEAWAQVLAPGYGGLVRCRLRKNALMGVRVKNWKDAGWVFIGHQRQRRAKRVGVGPRGKTFAEAVALRRNNVWTPMLRRTGLRYRKPHTLRHTFVSLLIEGGESLKYVQEQLGHHSPAYTLAVYGHLLPRGERRAVDRLDDVSEREPGASDHAESDTLANETAQIHEDVSLPAH